MAVTRSPSARASPRLPVRAGTGGYLRSPFDICPAFRELAERHALSRTRAALPPPRPRAADDGDDGDGDEGAMRAWPRAGVGARSLTAKERRLQQAQAERVYGVSHDGNDDDDDNDGGDAKTQPLFALDAQERQALRRVVPRHVRRELATRHERAATTTTASSSSPMTSVRAHGGRASPHSTSTAAATTRHVDGAAATTNDDDEAMHKGSAATTASTNAKTSTTTVTTAKARAPLDRVHQLDALRRQALSVRGKRPRHA